MPKGGGSKTPQLDHFPLNTDMVEKQGGKKVRKEKHCAPQPNVCIQRVIPNSERCLSLKLDSLPRHLIYFTTLEGLTDGGNAG